MKIDKTILKQVIDKWGMFSQIILAMEEMSELTKALCKYYRYYCGAVQDDIYRTKIIEEMADVYIMIKQMEILFCDENDLQNEIDRKMERLQRLIENDKKI